MDTLLDKETRLLGARWQMLAVMGVASILLGTFAVVASLAATVATVFFLGCLLVGGGIVHLIQSFHTRGWGGFFGHALATVLYGIVGGYMILHPAASAAPLTLLVGMLLAVGGIYQMITSAALRYRSWGWALLHGAISVLLGVLIFAQWPASALWVIGTFMGIDLIFRGWATLMLALAARTGAASVLKHLQVDFEERRVHLIDRRVAA